MAERRTCHIFFTLWQRCRSVACAVERRKRAAAPSAAARSSRVVRESERVDAFCETRQFARDGVPVQHATQRAAMELGLRGGECGARNLSVARRDRRLHLFHEGADAADTHAIDRRAAPRLADALFCRNM